MAGGVGMWNFFMVAIAASAALGALRASWGVICDRGLAVGPPLSESSDSSTACISGCRPWPQAGLGLPGFTAIGAALAIADIESGLAMPVESALAVLVAVSVAVWLLLHAASRPRAATGAAALFRK